MEIFTYDFMIRAFIIAGLSTVLASILGNFLVASRQSMVPAMLSHVSLGGVGIGIFFYYSPYLVAILVSLVASTILFFLTRDTKHPPEAVSMMLFTGGVAIALLFSHLAKDNPVALETFLFGSMLTTTITEIYIFAGIFTVGIIFLFSFWNRILSICFDREFTQSHSKYSGIIEWFFFVLLGVVVAFSLKTIGALLIGALLIIPVLAAQIFAKTFRSSVIWSMIINIIGVFSGIIISFYVDVPTSSAIVLSLISLFISIQIIYSFFKRVFS